jgi:hypothetical protein
MVFRKLVIAGKLATLGGESRAYTLMHHFSFENDALYGKSVCIVIPGKTYCEKK